MSLNTVNGKLCKGIVCLFTLSGWRRGDWDTEFTLQMTTKTCNIQGTGSARYVASGSVWFNYDNAVFANSIFQVFEPLTVLISDRLKMTRRGINIINVGFIYTTSWRAILISVIDAVDIASVLKNIDDRSSSMTFSGAMQITSKTDAGAKCS